MTYRGARPWHTTAAKNAARKKNAMIEEWRAIPGWEGYYEASSQGRIRSVDRVIETKTGPQRYKSKIISPALEKSGHLRVNLMRNGKPHTQRVHRLVLMTFCGHPPEGMEACHWNDIGSDNRLENLRWGTRSDNTYDKVRNGNHLNAKKTHCKNGHEFNEKNTKITCRGTRACNSCDRASAYISRHPELKKDKQKIADAYFNAL